ncbi:unnamed protein product [Withania somnifera]
MRSLNIFSGEDVSYHLLITVLAAVLFRAIRVVSVVAPNTGCYALDNSSHIHDFDDADLVVRFCKDVESRSQAGYVDYGRFDILNYFHVGAIIELAIPCEEPGLQVFKGFTAGFNPWSWEIVYNGLTQLGFEEAHKEFSFNAAQTRVALYMTVIASVSGSVLKPLVKVSPEQGLKVRLSGSAATGGSPTTLSPTVLLIDWRCDVARDNPYEVEVTIPIENYVPVLFTLTKICEYQQSEGGDAAGGWAIFGVLSCIVLVASTLFCCGGFIYKTSAESVSRPEDVNNPFANQASWEHQPASTQTTRRTSEVRYGSI